MRAGYKVFAEATSDPRFAFSSWILESYGRKGPQTFPAGFNAVAPEERENHILMSASFLWDGPAVGEVAETATKHVTTIREITRSKVSKPHTYVNYSPWSSPLQEVFGRDPGRVERLKALKKQWDPKNKFGYYSGIA